MHQFAFKVLIIVRQHLFIFLGEPPGVLVVSKIHNIHYVCISFLCTTLTFSNICMRLRHEKCPPSCSSRFVEYLDQLQIRTKKNFELYENAIYSLIELECYCREMEMMRCSTYFLIYKKNLSRSQPGYKILASLALFTQLKSAQMFIEMTYK